MSVCLFTVSFMAASFVSVAVSCVEVWCVVCSCRVNCQSLFVDRGLSQVVGTSKQEPVILPYACRRASLPDSRCAQYRLTGNSTSQTCWTAAAVLRLHLGAAAARGNDMRAAAVLHGLRSAVASACGGRAQRSKSFSFMPIVIENTGRGERAYDLYSRLLKVPPEFPLLALAEGASPIHKCGKTNIYILYKKINIKNYNVHYGNLARKRTTLYFYFSILYVILFTHFLAISGQSADYAKFLDLASLMILLMLPA